MKKIEITINGKAYPCRQTMGAMLRFRQETGREITATDGGLSDMCTYLHFARRHESMDGRGE